MRRNLFTQFLPMRYIIALAFIVNSMGPVSLAQADEFRLPVPGVMVHLSPSFNPPMLKGIKVHPDNPFRFDFILDKGDSAGTIASEATQSQQEQLKIEATKLIKYFLASLTIPEKDLWVNLSPYEKQRIIPQSFGLTEMGRDLLAEDYMLKQITASLIYPEDSIGKKFWKRVYEIAAQKYGSTNIPVNTFNKVWIVPEKAVVYENAKTGTAYVIESSLKVMLEQDYLSLSKHVSLRGSEATEAISKRTTNSDINALGSQIIREIVIPELTKEVNEDKNFSQLRQVYSSVILATWYKKKIKDSILTQVYANKNKVAGIDNDDPKETQKIYQRYLQAFKKGVYNYIKEEQDPLTQGTIPRKYFSGGTFLGRVNAAMRTVNSAKASDIDDHKLEEVSSAIGVTNVRPGGTNISKWISLNNGRFRSGYDFAGHLVPGNMPNSFGKNLISVYEMEQETIGGMAWRRYRLTDQNGDRYVYGHLDVSGWKPVWKTMKPEDWKLFTIVADDDTKVPSGGIDVSRYFEKADNNPGFPLEDGTKTERLIQNPFSGSKKVLLMDKKTEGKRKWLIFKVTYKNNNNVIDYQSYVDRKMKKWEKMPYIAGANPAMFGQAIKDRVVNALNNGNIPLFALNYEHGNEEEIVLKRYLENTNIEWGERTEIVRITDENLKLVSSEGWQREHGTKVKAYFADRNLSAGQMAHYIGVSLEKFNSTLVGPEDWKKESRAKVKAYFEKANQTMEDLENVQNTQIDSLEKKKNNGGNIDHLTGALNRNTIEESYLELMKTRNIKGAAVVIWDIDHFKSVNDLYGHPVGDDLLKVVANILRKHLRADSGDKLFRLGGEEFVIFMPFSETKAILEAKLNQIREAIEKEAYLAVPALEKAQHVVTISGGAAYIESPVSDRQRQNPNLNEQLQSSYPIVYETADQELYDIKHNGRNHIGIREMSLALSSPAMATPEGGIDLTPANMNLQARTGAGNDRMGIKFRLDPAQLAQLQNAPGFVPVVVNMEPMTNISDFLGLADNQSASQT